MHFLRWAAVIGVIAVGSLAAMPFSRDGSGPPEAPEVVSAAPELVPMIEVPATMLQASHARRAPAEPIILTETLDQPTPKFEPSPAVWETETVQPLPEEPPPPLPPYIPFSLRPVAAKSPGRIQEPSSPPPETPVSPKPRRKHRIVDGDSLDLIALRYLGDAARAGEIAALNADVIRDPNLLPVGKELRIPKE